MKQQIAAGEFKAKCLSLLDDVEKTRQEIVITKRGRPVARVVPIEKGKAQPTWGRMQGTIEILGDIISPIDEKWDAVEGKWDPDED
jgi:prevent-host-death family protein